jgi:hypothetical protein
MEKSYCKIISVEPVASRCRSGFNSNQRFRNSYRQDEGATDVSVNTRHRNEKRPLHLQVHQMIINI